MIKRTLSCLAATANIAVFAQSASNGVSAINQATSEIRMYIHAGIQLYYMVCVIIAIVGAVKAVSKWHNGDPDTTKYAVTWIGGSVFAIIAITIVKAFFNV